MQGCAHEAVIPSPTASRRLFLATPLFAPAFLGVPGFSIRPFSCALRSTRAAEVRCPSERIGCLAAACLLQGMRSRLGPLALFPPWMGVKVWTVQYRFPISGANNQEPQRHESRSCGGSLCRNNDIFLYHDSQLSPCAPSYSRSGKRSSSNPRLSCVASRIFTALRATARHLPCLGDLLKRASPLNARPSCTVCQVP